MIEIIIGLSIVACYMGLAYLAAWTGRRDGSTWVPINSSFKYGSDDNIYAALVNSVRQRGGGFDWPAIDCPGCREFEILRIGSYRLAALLGGCLSSPRWLLLLSQVVAVLTHYSLAHVVIWLVSGSSLGALLGALGYMFYFNVLAYPITTFKHTIRMVYNRSREAYFDALGDHFRYVILSVASLFGVSVVVLSEVAVLHGKWWYTALGLALSLLPFSYPGTMIAFGMYGAAFLTLHQLTNFDPQAICMLALGGAPMLLFTLVTGKFRAFLKALRVAPPVLSLIHCGSATVKDGSVWTKFSQQLFSLPVSLAFLSTLIASIAGVAVKMNLAVVATALVISAIGAFPGVGRAVARMQFRGAATLYQLVFYATVAAAATKWLPVPDIVPWLLLIPLGFMPLLGSYRMFRTHQANQTFSIEPARLHLYTVLRHKARPDDTVACLDIRDLQLAPVYGNGTAYVGGGEWLSLPELAISRQAALMQHCGINPDALIDWMQSYFEKKKLIKASPMPPHAAEEEVEGAITLNHLVFYPYISQFDGVTISLDNQSWTPEFIERFTAAVERGKKTGIQDKPPTFILISELQNCRRSQPGTAPDGYELVDEQSGHMLFRHL